MKKGILLLTIFGLITIPFKLFSQEKILKKIDLEAPIEYTVEEPYPNPFGFVTSFKIGVPDSSIIKCSILSSDSVLVRLLLDSSIGKGFYQVFWDLKDDDGKKITKSGFYIFRISISSISKSKLNKIDDFNTTVRLHIFF
jgi:hypothetical protein